MIRTLRYTALLVIISSMLITCRKKDKDDECPVCPSVESISPTSAKCYEKITIFGKNFAATPSANIVKINGMQVHADSIVSGTTSQLVVRVPKGCGTGPVTVDIDNELTNVGDPPIFTYIPRYIVSDIGGTGNKPPPCINGGNTNSLVNYNTPIGIVADNKGNVFFSDAGAHCIFRLSSADNYQSSCVFAGQPESPGSNDNFGTFAGLNMPMQMYIDENNSIYIAEEGGDTIRTVSPSGSVSKLRSTGNNMGPATAVALQKGNSSVIYTALGKSHVIVKITKQGSTTTNLVLAGTKGTSGYADGAGAAALFKHPSGIVVDNTGNIFVSEEGNYIRKITPTGVVSTFAGNGLAFFADGQGTQASFNDPRGMCIDSNNNIYVADNKNNCIRKITPGGLVSTVFTFTDAMTTPAPSGVAIDKNGNFFVTYRGNLGNGVKKLTIE